MSSTWNGSALQTRFAGKHGFTDATSLTRILEYIDDIQKDIASGNELPFLKFKMKKLIEAGTQEVDLSPEIPDAPTVELLAGGSLTVGTAYSVKVTFVLFDESGKEFYSIESEPSDADSATPTTGNQKLNVTEIPLYAGDTDVKPTNIHRRIYVKKGTGNYQYYSTIEDNFTTETTVTADPTSTIEPPEYSMVDQLAGEDPFIESLGQTLYENKLDDLHKYDPALSTTGTPSYYSRTTRNKIMLYPRPSANITLSYWVYRVPARVFADTDRVLQLEYNFKQALDAGVTWKGYEYKDSDGQESKRANYEDEKSKAYAKYKKTGGQAPTVKVVC
jgi:hypothetical protein